MNELQIGRYSMVRELGKGAMGIVYEGYDPRLDRKVAIKTIRTEELTPSQAALYEARFLTEARSVARLSHPNIVSVHDSGQSGSMTYLVMEYVHGINLKHCLNHGVAFTPAGAVHVALAALAGLGHAHEEKIIHRDVKPENLLLDEEGWIKLTDFGIAKIMDAEVDNGTQVFGQTVGTPRYMSPEQVRGMHLDERSDLFSTGVLLYELLTGVLPFDGPTQLAIATQILHDQPPLVSKVNPDVPKELDAIVVKALAKQAEDRYPSVEAFRDALSAVLPLVQPKGTVVHKATDLVTTESAGMLRWLMDKALNPGANASAEAAGGATGMVTQALSSNPGRAVGASSLPGRGMSASLPGQAPAPKPSNPEDELETVVLDDPEADAVEQAQLMSQASGRAPDADRLVDALNALGHDRDPARQSVVAGRSQTREVLESSERQRKRKRIGSGRDGSRSKTAEPPFPWLWVGGSVLVLVLALAWFFYTRSTTPVPIAPVAVSPPPASQVNEVEQTLSPEEAVITAPVDPAAVTPPSAEPAPAAPLDSPVTAHPSAAPSLPATAAVTGATAAAVASAAGSNRDAPAANNRPVAPVTSSANNNATPSPRNYATDPSQARRRRWEEAQQGRRVQETQPVVVAAPVEVRPEPPAPPPPVIVQQRPQPAREPCAGMGFLQRESCLWSACEHAPANRHPACARFVRNSPNPTSNP